MDASYWVAGISAIIVAALGSSWLGALIVSKREKTSEVYKKIDEIETWVNDYIGNMKNMVMGQTYVNIVRTCEFWLERGWAEQDDIRDLEHYLYDPYREWGGNGTAERLFKQVCELPNKPEEKEDDV